MDNEQCAKKWAQRFRDIITQYMICTKDVMRRLSEICDVSIVERKWQFVIRFNFPETNATSIRRYYLLFKIDTMMMKE